MGRNLSRQPEQESALSFLQRAHEVRRSATAEMQMGLRRSEQQEVHGLAPTTLAPAMQRRRVLGRMAEMTERLGRWTEEPRHVLNRLTRLAPAAQEMVTQAIEKLRPIIEKAAERIRQRPERVAARKQAAEMNAAREELLALRMRAFEREQRAGSFYVDSSKKRQWEEKACVEAAKQRIAIAGFDPSDLRQTLQHEQTLEQDQVDQVKARPFYSKGLTLSR